MALLALSKGQLLILIYKMCKENDMLDMYDKRYLKFSTQDLASEYLMIENLVKNYEKNKNKDSNIRKDINSNYKLF